MQRTWVYIKRALLLAAAAMGVFFSGCSKPSSTGTIPSPSPTQTVAAHQADLAQGKNVYDTSCVACHGANAKGVKGLGKDLVDSAFVKSQSDDALVEFVEKGRDATDPANTTKVAMPPKGGNPALTRDQLIDVVAYLRSLTK